jgi:hypothetical protein
MESVLDLRDRGLLRDAVRVAIAAAAIRPLNVRHAKPLVYALAPRWLIDAWRSRRIERDETLINTASCTTSAGSTVEIKPDASASRESMLIQPLKKAPSHV